MVGFEKPSKMPTYRILSKDDLYSIHWACLDILKETGIRIVEGEEVLKMLNEKGCTVNFDQKTVFFSPSMVEECLKKASKVATIYSPRNSKYDYRLDGRHIYFETDALSSPQQIFRMMSLRRLRERVCLSDTNHIST